MILIELFNTASSIHQTSTTNDTNVFEFAVGDVSYEVLFRKCEEDKWEVCFKQLISTPSTRTSKLANKNDYKATNNMGSSAIKVFSEVLNIIQHFITTRTVTMLLLTADMAETARIRLYDNLVNKLTKQNNFRYNTDTYRGVKLYFVHLTQ